MSLIRVGVMRGGPSHEYEVSLRTGQSVIEHLSPERYQTKDILITRDGAWHLNGLPTSLEHLRPQVDVIFNALHGKFGEDGEVQSLLDRFAIPYTGSGHLASALGMNKHLAKESFVKAGLMVPPGELVRADEDLPARIGEIFRHLAPPWVVKPLNRGSSVGLSYALTLADLARALSEAIRYSDIVLVERYLRGKEATCGVIDNFRNQDLYALPPIEIRRPAGEQVWGYESKYNGATKEVCPGNFTLKEKQAIEAAAVAAHQTLGLRHYSRSDFIVTPRGVYILETNTLPGMTSESLLPKALEVVGCPYPKFLDHVIDLALAGR